MTAAPANAAAPAAAATVAAPAPATAPGVVDALAAASCVRIAASPWSRLRGLLFRDPAWLGEAGVLVLVPCKSVHTFLMRHALDIAFVDARGRVVRAERAVPSGRVLSAPHAVAVLERFANPDLPWPASVLKSDCQLSHACGSFSARALASLY